jgi:hypothetical protein
MDIIGVQTPDYWAVRLFSRSRQLVIVSGKSHDMKALSSAENWPPRTRVANLGMLPPVREPRDSFRVRGLGDLPATLHTRQVHIDGHRRRPGMVDRCPASASV